MIATTNVGKLQELRTLLADLPLELVSLEDVGISDDVEEDGVTYLSNSQKKALFYAKKSKLPTIADDGGLEIAALNFEPGVRSRRWLGYEASDEELIENMKKIAKELPDDNRVAFFKVVLTLALPSGEMWSVDGYIEGIIAKEPYLKLLQGYPYRSFFYLPQIQKFYHEQELTEEEQKHYNHRYKAVKKLKPIIKEKL